MPLFILLRRREPIRSRGWVIPVMQMTAALVDMVMRSLLWRRTTCLMDNWRGILLLPLWLFPYYGRAFVLWYNFSLQQVLLLRQGHTKKGRTALWLQAHPWFVSVRAQVTLFVLLAASFTVVAFAVYFTTCLLPAPVTLSGRSMLSSSRGSSPPSS